MPGNYRHIDILSSLMIQLEANWVGRGNGGGGRLFLLLHINSHFFDVLLFRNCIWKMDKGLTTKGQPIFQGVIVQDRSETKPSHTCDSVSKIGLSSFQAGWHLHGQFVYLTRRHCGVMTDCSALLTATEWVKLDPISFVCPPLCKTPDDLTGWACVYVSVLVLQGSIWIKVNYS